MPTENPVSLVPPFTRETAVLKVRKAEDGWNSRDPERVALVYTVIPDGATGRNSLTAGSRLLNF